MHKRREQIYPGNGACEVCGEVDPCLPCSGIRTLSAPWTVRQARAQVPKQDSDQEKTNSISTSITKE